LRLILLIIGFLLAISASGLPIDRITIVLGALGVGIGLGLQNIVNNLVSGIILIFESPFKIGDSIEVGNKKGRVKNLGIRSSRLLTSDGSEIVVPNADLLSGQVINWSVNNNMGRCEIILKVEPDNFESANDYILKILTNSANISKKNNPMILLNSLSDNFVELKAQFWINNIRNEQAVKSEIFMEIYRSLKEHNIKIM
jgi:potassium efflux system protein